MDTKLTDRARLRRAEPVGARAYGNDAQGRAEQPAGPAHAFASAICSSDRTAADDVARRQAARLVSPGGTVELVPLYELTRQGRRALHDRCDGSDLLALGAGSEAGTAVRCAPIPVLIARPCPPGTEVTDRIVVCVDDSPDCDRAVRLAGLLAAAHDGTVTILGAPPRDPALERAVAASFRVLIETTGKMPRVVGEPRSAERVIASAAVDLSASLVVLGCGSTPRERTLSALTIGVIGCSVLAVPGSADATHLLGS